MAKRSQSVRLKPEHGRRLGRAVARLSLNPAIVGLADRVVDWSGKDPARMHPSDLVARAHERFPRLALSWAVEGYLVLLLLGDAAALEPITIAPFPDLPEEAKRFSKLSPIEKTRWIERRKRTLAKLRAAR